MRGLKEKFSESLPPLLAFFIFTIFFELLVRAGVISSTLIPAPTQVLETLIEMRTDFLKAGQETLQNALCGLIFSIFFGGGTALLFSLFEILKKAILPFAVFFQTVPIIAIAPLLVIYFGFGAPTVIAASFIVSIFPVIAGTLTGLENVSPQQRDLLRIYKARPWQVLIKLKIPSAYSHIFSGLKVAAGLSLIGAIAGEFVAGGGLGAMIDAARTQQRVDIVFASLLLLSFLGWLFIATLNFINSQILHRRPFSPGELR